jgi:multiple sugar transport system substrate-binding protein
MRTKQLWLIIWVLLLTSCTTRPLLTETALVESSNEPELQAPLTASDSKELEIWSMGYLDDVIERYSHDHGITIHHRQIPREEFDTVLEALANGEGPDLLSIENSYLGLFSHLSIMEDLRSPEFDLEFIKRAFPGLNLDRYLSLDGSSLYAVPRDIPGTMTFYRADILREHGFPDEPEALGRFLEDPENWLSMAIKLKQHNIYTLQWPFELLDMISLGDHFFDREGKYIRSGPRYEVAFSLAQRAEKAGLVLNKSIWAPDGQEAIRRGELAMVYLGEWATANLKDWAPETAQLWQMTRLPFNTYSIHGGSVFMIPKQSQNKARAWDFIRSVIEIDKPYRESLASYKYFDQLPASAPLPFDDKLMQKWKEEVEAAIYKYGALPEESLSRTQALIEKQYSEELSIWREVLQSTDK